MAIDSTLNTRLVIPEPKHFHSGLVLGKLYDDISGLDMDREVLVFHSPGNTLSAFKGITGKGEKAIDAEGVGYRIEYRPSERPLEDMMLSRQAGDIAVIATRNCDKPRIIQTLVNSDYRLLLVDKPWAIDEKGRDILMETIPQARSKGIILQDLMTERYAVGSVMQQLLVGNPDVFGKLVPGTEDNPALLMRTVHILDKTSMGVFRPPEYFEENVQGDGTTDVAVHAVDFLNILARPDSAIPFRDVRLVPDKIEMWNTQILPANYAAMTKGADTIEEPSGYRCNGRTVYEITGNDPARDNAGQANVFVGIEATWNLEGVNDEHYSKAVGTRATVEVEKKPNQDAEVYVTPKAGEEANVISALRKHCRQVLDPMGYGGITFEKEGDRLKLNIPEHLHTQHFDHFTEVTHQALRGLTGKEEFPAMEYRRLLTKYQTTTGAHAIAMGKLQ